MPETAEQERRRKERLTQAEEDESLIFRKGWDGDRAFCADWLDRCEQAALVDSPRALGMAHTAVRMAEALGDPHLIHAAYGVLVHAHIGRVDFFWAGKTLEGYLRKAIDCCPRCRADVLRRKGDLMGEERRSEESLALLDDCLAEGADIFDDDERGRTFFLRSIPRHHRGHRERALDDTEAALRLISLDSPHGYFDDTMACIAIYLRGGGPEHDTRALAQLAAFHERIRGRKGFRPARRRRRWVEAQIHSRLGNFDLAARRMERALHQLLAEGIGREALAVTLDFAQLKTRPSALRDDNLLKVRRVIGRCLDLRPDLPKRQRKRLEKIKDEVLPRHPRDAFRAFGELRRSFVAPVPGILDERIDAE